MKTLIFVLRQSTSTVTSPTLCYQSILMVLIAARASMASIKRALKANIIDDAALIISTKALTTAGKA